MFARAGFREDYTFVCAAIVGRLGRRWVRPAYLVRWDWSDVLWVGAANGGTSWPEHIVILNQIRAPVWPHDLPQSELPQ